MVKILIQVASFTFHMGQKGNQVLLDKFGKAFVDGKDKFYSFSCSKILLFSWVQN